MVLPSKLSSKSLNKAARGEQTYRVFMSFLLSNIKAWTAQFCDAKGLVGHRMRWCSQDVQGLCIAEVKMKSFPSHRELMKPDRNKICTVLSEQRDKWTVGTWKDSVVRMWFTKWVFLECKRSTTQTDAKLFGALEADEHQTSGTGSWEGWRQQLWENKKNNKGVG